MDEFLQYKLLIMGEITTLKNDFKEFRKETTDKINTLSVTLAVLNTKILMLATISSTVTGAIIAYVMDKILK